MTREQKDIRELWEELSEEMKTHHYWEFTKEMGYAPLSQEDIDERVAKELQENEKGIEEKFYRNTQKLLDKHSHKMISQFKKERSDTFLELFDGALERVFPAAILIAKAQLVETPDIEPNPNRVRYDGPNDPLFLPLWLYYNEVLEKKRKVHTDKGHPEN